MLLHLFRGARIIHLKNHSKQSYNPSFFLTSSNCKDKRRPSSPIHIYSGQTSPFKSAHKTQSANGSIIAWARKNNTLPTKTEWASASSLFACAAATNAGFALSKGSLEIFGTKAVNCSGGNLQARQENRREGSLEIYGTKAVNCSGGNLQARQENEREGSLEIYGTKVVNRNGGNLQARRGFYLGKKMQNCRPGAQMPILPRKKNSELSCHRQTSELI